MATKHWTQDPKKMAAAIAKREKTRKVTEATLVAKKKPSPKHALLVEYAKIGAQQVIEQANKDIVTAKVFLKGVGA